MKQSSKCAIGGIISALSLVMMISVAIIPFLTYALPAAAGLLIVPVVIEIDKKWALGVYVTVSILAILLVPDKEVAVMYAAFFGYYPVIKAVFEKHLPAALSYLLKAVCFAGAMLSSYYLMIKFMGLELDELEEFGAFAVPLLLGMGLVAFILYDFVLTRFVIIYDRKWRKYFKRYFK
ncbi:MAG: hypothetical protein IJ050_02855 [Clostridia bacterium]|nr:hypothetical protein [Clostridia bacterium]MBR0122201.1 hypothetical protein [Clostridia bacterium]